VQNNASSELVVLCMANKLPQHVIAVAVVDGLTKSGEHK
jgi:hypothetical protein